jgi:hypothetical protein
MDGWMDGERYVVGSWASRRGEVDGRMDVALAEVPSGWRNGEW